jgi:hypothetical protein
MRVFRADLPLQRILAGVGDALDLEAVVVEDDLLRIGLALEVERSGAADAPRVEIDIEIERDVGDPRFERLGETVDVDRVGCREDRGSRRLGGLGRRLPFGALAGREEQDRAQQRRGDRTKLHWGPSAWEFRKWNAFRPLRCRKSSHRVDGRRAAYDVNSNGAGSSDARRGSCAVCRLPPRWPPRSCFRRAS